MLLHSLMFILNEPTVDAVGAKVNESIKSKEYNPCSKWSHAALSPLCRQADTSPQRGRGAIFQPPTKALPLPNLRFAQEKKDKVE